MGEVEEEIIVKAKKIDSISDWKEDVSSTNLNSEEIILIDAQHPKQLFTRVPGVWISRGSGQEHLTSIRSPVLTGPGACGSFLILEDGIPIRPSGFCNVNGLFETQTEIASSIEVIRGPASARYGSNAMHGVINVVSKPIEDINTISSNIGPNGYTNFKSSIGDSESWRINSFFSTDDGLRNAAISLLTAQKLRQETESRDEEPTIDHLPFAAPYTEPSVKGELLDSLADFAIPEADATHNDFSDTPLDQLAGDLFETLREHLSGNIPDHHQQSDSSEPVETIEYNAALRRASLARDVFEGSRVLWIDDEIDSVELEKQTLEHLGIRVTTARTTQEALGRLRTASFDLILSDIERAGDPDEGVLVIPQFEEIAPNTPIVFYIAQFDEQRGIPQGASGITNRPDELLHLVLDQLERARI